MYVIDTRRITEFLKRILFIWQRKSEHRQKGEGGEAGSLGSREPSAGLNLRTLGS